MEAAAATTLFLLLLAAGWAQGAHSRKVHPDMELHTAHRHTGAIGMIGGAAAVMTVILLASLKFDTLAQTFPLLLQRYTVLFVWMLIGLFLPLFSGYVLSVLAKEKRRIFFAAVILLDLFFLDLAYDRNTPVYREIVPLRPKRTPVTFQTTLYTCAPASLSTIIRSYGKELNEYDAARMTGTTRYGTTAGQLRYALDQLGFGYETLNGRYESLGDVEPRAILFIDRRDGYENHAVAYWGKAGDRYRILDPMDGDLLLSAAEIAKRWHGNGIRVYR